MSDKGAKLHYIRGMHFVDKILNKSLQDGYDVKNEYAFFEDVSYKSRKDSLFLFDLNNFIFSCSVALMGLNKESIEESDNHKAYGYQIDYNIETTGNILEKTYNSFKRKGTIDSPYSKWLAIKSVSSNVPSTNNFLFNVRNSLMHSEYDCEFYNEEGYNYSEVNLHNSNYTGFEGSIYIPYYLEFMKHYYSNDAYFGILRDFYVMTESEIKPSKENIEEFLKSIKLQKYRYENKKDASRRIEKKYSKPNVKLKDSLFQKEDAPISDDELEQVKLIIEKYYGDDFFGYDKEMQSRIVFQAIKYAKDPKTVLSEWIMHYYLCTRCAMREVYPDEEFISVFAAEPSMLLVKSYLILYRMQNKYFEDVDYSLMDNIDYSYDTSESYYNDFKNKLVNKGINVSEDEYKKRYFCEIYRNSLAHGNVKIDMRKENDGSIVQYFVFEDIYGTRNRKITISQEELKRFTNFEAFSRKCATLKTVSGESKTISRR